MDVGDVLLTTRACDTSQGSQACVPPEMHARAHGPERRHDLGILCSTSSFQWVHRLGPLLPRESEFYTHHQNVFDHLCCFASSLLFVV